MRLARLAAPGMGLLLLSYILAHSPALPALARVLGRRGAACYFICSGWAPYGRPADAIAALVALVLACWAGWLLALRTSERQSEQVLLTGLFTIALVVVPAAWIGLLGWWIDAPLLTPPLGPLLTVLPSATLVAISRTRGRRVPGHPARALPLSRLALVLSATALVLLGASAAITIAHPPTGYDALSYHGPLAVYYWRDGNLGSYLARQIWAWALSHPGSSELLIGLIRIAGGERMASLGQLPYALLGAAAVHVLGRRTGLPARLAVLGALAFLMAPMVVVQAGMQLNDLAAGSLVLCVLALAAAPPERWSPALAGATGLALALAVTTKLAVLPAAAGALVYLAIRLREAREPRILVRYGALAFLSAGAPWWIRNGMLFDNPIFPAALPFIGRGYVVGDFLRKDDWFVPHELAWPLYPMLEGHGEMSGFGALLLVGAVPGLLLALPRARRGPLALLALVAVLSVIAWWKLSQHEPRLLLGVVGAAFALLGWAPLAVPREHRRVVAAILMAAGLFSAAVTLGHALAPLAAAPGARNLFYETEWGIDSTVALLPERDGLLYHTGHAYRSYAGDYPLLGPHQGRSIAVIDGVLSTDAIVATMRAQDYRLAYVPARTDADATIREMYSPDRFELVQVSSAAGEQWTGIRRYLFRLREDASQ